MSQIATTFDDVLAGEALKVKAGKSFTYLLEVADGETFDGEVVLERSTGGSYETLETFDDAATVVTVPAIDKDAFVRLRCTTFGEGSDNIVGTLADAVDDIKVMVNDDGVEYFAFTEQGFRALVGAITTLTATTINGHALSQASNLSSSEAATTGADPVDCDISVYQTVVTTGGTQGNEELNIGDGTGATVGQRHLVTLGTLTDTDTVVLDDANISQGADSITAVALDTADQFIMLEWQGATWEVIAASAGVVTTA